MQDEMNSLEDLNNQLDGEFADKRIPISTEEQLLKIGTGEEVSINGKVYKFETGKIYALQNDIECTGNYENVANLIKNGEIEFMGQGHQIVVTNEKGMKEYYTQESKYYIATNKQGYASKGLELYYDGIDNAGEGKHSNTTTTWKDLSGNNRDGQLNNFGTSAISGWNNNYLSFDGVNDWVGCGEINNENITLEAVHRLKSDTEGNRHIVANYQSGGYGLGANKGILEGAVYTNSQYYTIESNITAQTYKNNIVVQSLTYNGQEEVLYLNANEIGKESISGDIENPLSNSIMVIGADPTSDIANGYYADVDVFSVRIYNRGLSREEIELNNKVDNRRFKNQEIVPIYTENQLLKVGSGEQVLVEQENKTYTYGTGVKYELKNDITTSGNYSNIVNKINNKEVEIIPNDYKITSNGVYYTGNSKYTIAVNKYGYVTNGLQLLYDGIDNTGSGHSSSATTWKDLSGNNRNGTLNNMTASSAWGSEGLKFDGIDDYVLIGEMNYDNITLEAVCTKGNISENEKRILANVESGGYDLALTPNYNLFVFMIYVSEKSSYTNTSTSNQEEENDVNAKYSISGSYNGEIMKFRTSNGPERATSYTQSQILGTIGKPQKNTYMMVGANPYGNKPTGEEYFNGEVSSIRIYNRALSDEENAVNFLNDRERYGV